MKKDFGLFFWLHMLFVIPAYLSPFLVDWKLIVFGVVILQIQQLILGGCILTHLEHGKETNTSFIWYYLQKRFPNLNLQNTRFFLRVWVPALLIMLGILLQVVFNFKPLIDLKIF